jgi:hypothetical protein
MHWEQNLIPINIFSNDDIRHTTCQPLIHEPQINIVVAHVTYPHNMQHNSLGTTTKNGLTCKRWHKKPICSQKLWSENWNGTILKIWWEPPNMVKTMYTRYVKLVGNQNPPNCFPTNPQPQRKKERRMNVWVGKEGVLCTHEQIFKKSVLGNLTLGYLGAWIRWLKT